MRWSCGRYHLALPHHPQKNPLLCAGLLGSVKVRFVFIAAVEYATLEWVDWFNNRRLLEPIGSVPPAELEMTYYRQREGSAESA